MRRRELLIAVPSALLVACAQIEQKAADLDGIDWLDAGPMIGHAGPDSLVVWLRCSRPVKLVADAQRGSVGHMPERIVDLGKGCVRIEFNGLPAATEFVVHVATTTDTHAPIELRARTAPLPSSIGTVRFAFGSCAKDVEFGAVPAFAAMADAEPDFALFVGDNCYFVKGEGSDFFSSDDGPGEWESQARMLDRHLATRRRPELQRLLRTTSCYAIWDDHDYGPNNSDKTFNLRDGSLHTFQRVWANPSYGTAATPGVFTSFRRGPVEVFLTDGRFHRLTPGNAKELGQKPVIWGADQLAWLLAGLEASTAPVKLVACGTQFINQGEHDDDHWHEARDEFFALLERVDRARIGGVAFLSGDRHYSEFMKLDRTGKPSIVEFTSSPLQQGRELGPLHDKNPTRVFAMNGNSFGLVTIDVRGPRDGTLTFEARTEHGDLAVVNGEPMQIAVDLRQLLWA